MVQKTLVPPDGGWGWLVMLGTALSNLCVLPIMYSFGLLFKDIFDNLGLNHKDASVILNTNGALGFLMGMVNGALLKYFGCRKVAIAAGLLLSAGVILTAFADTFLEFLIFYGCIASFGMGMSRSAFNLALNTYFLEKRGRAISLAMTITGIGPILLPQLISFLMEDYTPQEAILIIGAISAHAIVAAFLLQPVKWHMKVVEVTEEEEKFLPPAKNEVEKKMSVIPEDESSSSTKSIAEKVDNNNKVIEEEKNAINLKLNENTRKKSIEDSMIFIDQDVDTGAIYGVDRIAAARSAASLHLGSRRVLRRTISEEQAILKKNWSTVSLHNVYLRDSVYTAETSVTPNKFQSCNFEIDLEKNVEKKESMCRTMLTKIVNFFDLTLLCDPIYLNIMIGMSLAVFVEINFSILTPFVYADLGLTLQENATCLSVLAVSDLIFRFLAPYIGDYLKQSARMMYIISLGMLIFVRIFLIMSSTYYHLILVSLALGVGRGVRIIYRNLIIPSYVPIDRLASASGMQMMLNGICILAGGPALGYIRDKTGSYDMCIHILNVLTLVSILAWSSEIAYFAIKKKKDEKTRS